MIDQPVIGKVFSAAPMLLLLAVVYSLPAFPLQKPETEEKPQRVFWKPEYAPLKPTCTFQPILTQSDWQRYLSSKVQRCFDNSLLSPGAEVQVSVLISEKGIPSCKSRLITGKDSDKFYCEQSIWDWAPYKGQLKNFQSELTFRSDIPSGRASSSKASNDTDLLVLHLVPPSVTETFHGPIKIGEISESTNRLSIRKSELSEAEIQTFRLSWIDFCEQHDGITEKDLSEQIAYLKKKCSTMFLLQKDQEKP